MTSGDKTSSTVNQGSAQTSITMDSDHAMESKIKVPVGETDKVVDDYSEGDSAVIYIDPEKEAAALSKFDKTVLPVSVIFLILSSLDRNNVS